MSHQTKYLQNKIKFAFHKLHLFHFLTSRYVRKTRTDQSIPRVFLLYLKRNDPQTIKSGGWKNLFLQCVCYWYNLLWSMLFILFITGRHYFPRKFINILRFFYSPYCCFLWNQFLERSLYFMRYPYNNTMMLIPKFQNKAYYTSWFLLLNLILLQFQNFQMKVFLMNEIFLY